MSSPAVEKINTLSAQQALILGLVVGLLYYIMIYDDGSQLENRIAQSKGQIAKSNSELESLKQAEVDAKRYAAIKREMGDSLNEVVKYIPEELSDFDLMNILSTEAKAAGANISNVTALSNTSKSTEIYEEVAISVELESTYTQLLMFLSFISRTDKIVVMREGSLNKTPTTPDTEGGVNLKFRGIFVGYRYKQKKDAGS